MNEVSIDCQLLVQTQVTADGDHFGGAEDMASMPQKLCRLRIANLAAGLPAEDNSKHDALSNPNREASDQ